MDTLASLLNGLSKSYLYTNLAKDVTRFVRRNLSDMDFDREALLQRAGLTSYRPGNSALLLTLGALAGAGIALALAPKKGSELRSDVKERAMTLFNRTEGETSERASRAIS